MVKRSDKSVSGAVAPKLVKAASNAPDPNSGDAHPLAKSADPAYVKFTTYIRRTTHLSVKTRLVSKRMELSDLVEELLATWLKENQAIVTGDLALASTMMRTRKSTIP